MRWQSWQLQHACAQAGPARRLAAWGQAAPSTTAAHLNIDTAGAEIYSLCGHAAPTTADFQAAAFAQSAGFVVAIASQRTERSVSRESSEVP